MKYKITKGVVLDTGKPAFEGAVLEYDELPSFLQGRAMELVEQPTDEVEKLAKPVRKNTKTK